MRNGYSTSACAAAASAAAIRALLTKNDVGEITIDLPILKGVAFPVCRCIRLESSACCGVIKDAGDDPDVTNGIEIQSVVRKTNKPGITLLGGKGIGKATLPGLPVAVGESAINPGSQKIILQAVEAELKRLKIDQQIGLEVKIQVPNGEQIAQVTMNPKLGIIGGISILGTDGIVRPYSTPAFKTSLFYEMKVAQENGYSSIGLATGKRSAIYLKKVMNDERGLGVIDVGDELAYPIEQMLKIGFKRIIIGGMIGKMSKVAQGRFRTHVKDGEVNFHFLSELSLRCGASAETAQRILTARTAHQVQNWLRAENVQLESEICRLGVDHLFKRCKEKLDAQIYLFSLNGEMLAQASRRVNDAA